MTTSKEGCERCNRILWEVEQIGKNVIDYAEAVLEHAAYLKNIGETLRGAGKNG